MQTVFGIFEVIEIYEFDDNKIIARYEDRLDAYERAVSHMKSGKCYGDVIVSEVYVYKKA